MYNLGGVRGAITERPQLFEFEVASCGPCLKKPFWKLPQLIFKNDEALLGSLHADLTPPNVYTVTCNGYH